LKVKFAGEKCLLLFLSTLNVYSPGSRGRIIPKKNAY